MDRISIDRDQVVQVDPDCLPPDAQCKGYEDVVGQDLVFHTDNVFSPFALSTLHILTFKLPV
jgi:hypothetical protein